MWFGNYVTMKWWDDLWLNEAFADHVAFRALANIKKKVDFEIGDSWVYAHYEKT